MNSLSGKVALVTGGSRGIGAAIAKRLAADGAKVILTYVQGKQAAEDIVAAIQAAGGIAQAVVADSSRPNEIDAAVAKTVDVFGPIDILVNNAGVFPTGAIEEFSPEAFDNTFAINVKAGFVASRAALKSMPDGGRIIFLGSTLAVRVPAGGLSLYAASKAAVAGMSQALARELGPRGITVNTVHPGSTNTDMNPADGPRAGQQREMMSNPTAFAEASEVADVVAFLASPAARSITGAAWTIDNGANA
jgi:3-oxoacyl-[acyl-carrier protein] reductase